MRSKRLWPGNMSKQPQLSGDFYANTAKSLSFVHALICPQTGADRSTATGSSALPLILQLVDTFHTSTLETNRIEAPLFGWITKTKKILSATTSQEQDKRLRAQRQTVANFWMDCCQHRKMTKSISHEPTQTSAANAGAASVKCALFKASSFFLFVFCPPICASRSTRARRAQRKTVKSLSPLCFPGHFRTWSTESFAFQLYYFTSNLIHK